MIYIFSRFGTIIGSANDKDVTNKLKLPKVRNSLDCTENYISNGSAIMPGEKTSKTVQTDNGSQTADSELHKDRKNNRVS